MSPMQPTPAELFALILKPMIGMRDLLRLFDIPRSILPKVLIMSGFRHDFPALFEKSYPIKGVAGDQQAALIGQACFAKGMVKSTYGTGCFALMNIGTEFKASHNKLLTSIGYRITSQTTCVGRIYFIAGAAIQFFAG